MSSKRAFLDHPFPKTYPFAIKECNWKKYFNNIFEFNYDFYYSMPRGSL